MSDTDAWHWEILLREDKPLEPLTKAQKDKIFWTGILKFVLEQPVKQRRMNPPRRVFS